MEDQVKGQNLPLTPEMLGMVDLDCPLKDRQKLKSIVSITKMELVL